MLETIEKYIKDNYVLIIYLALLCWLLILVNIKKIYYTEQFESIEDYTGNYRKVGFYFNKGEKKLYLSTINKTECLNKKDNESGNISIFKTRDKSDKSNLLTLKKTHNDKYHITNEINSKEHYLSTSQLLIFDNPALCFETIQPSDKPSDFDQKTLFEIEKVEDKCYLTQNININNKNEKYYIGVSDGILCQSDNANYLKAIITNKKENALLLNLELLDESAII